MHLLLLLLCPFQPSGTSYPSLALHDILSLCIESSEKSPHSLSQAFKRLLAWPWVHRVLSEVVEQDTVDYNETDQTPLHYLCPFVPLRAYRLELDASLEFALEPELLLFCQSAEVRRPLLLDAVLVARKVKGWECILLATEDAIQDAQHVRWPCRCDDSGRTACVFDWCAMQILGCALSDVLYRSQHGPTRPHKNRTLGIPHSDFPSHDSIVT